MKLSDLNPEDYTVDQSAAQPEQSSAAMPTEQTNPSALKLSDLNPDDYEVESHATPVSSKELKDAESLASKAYGAADLAAEGLTRGWKSELQSGIENVLMPHYFGREMGYKDVLPFLKSDEEKADDVAAQREAFDRYQASKEGYQAQTDKFRKDNPRLAYGAELTGMMLPYALFPATAGVAANTALGGVEGALVGSGKSEAPIGSEQFNEDTAINAGLGALFGGTATKLMQVAPKAAPAMLLGAAATPLLTGEQNPEQMGIGALVALLASKGRINPGAIAPKFIRDIYNASKSGVDLTSREGAEKATNAIIANANEIAQGTAQAQKQIANPAAEKVTKFFQSSIDALGDVIAKAGGDKDEAMNDLAQRVYRSYEASAKQFAEENPGKVIPVNDIIENATQALREGIETKLPKPEDRQIAENTLKILNRLGKVKDENVTIAQQQKLSPLSSEPEIATTITGASPQRAQTLAEATPEELLQQGFEEAAGPQRFVTKPERITTTSGSTAFSEPMMSSSQKVSGAGNVLEQSRSATGSNITPESLINELNIPSELPTDASFATQKITPQQETETATRIFTKLFPGKAGINELSLPETVQFIKELNAISPGKGYSQSVIGNLKSSLDARVDELTRGTPYEGLAAKRGQYGEVLGAKQVLETESTKDVSRLVQDMVAAKNEGRYQDYRQAFDTIKKFDPELASKLEDTLLGEGSKMQNLIARSKANPSEKVLTLEEQGIQIPEEISQAKQTVEEINTIQNLAGGPSENVNVQGMPIADKKAITFAQDMGQLQGRKFLDAKRNQELQAALELIQKHNPELADKLRNKMAYDADIARMILNVQGNQGLSSLGFVPTTATGALVKTGQVVGLNKLTAHAGQLAAKIDKKAAIIAEKTKPYIAAPVESIIKALNENRQVFGQFDAPLRNAYLNRGEGALRATIYMLSQQYPEFRLMTEQMEEESRNKEK